MSEGGEAERRILKFAAGWLLVVFLVAVVTKLLGVFYV